MTESKQIFQWQKVTIVSLSHLLHDIYSSFLAPILPLLIEKLGIGYTQAGLLSLAQRIPSAMNPVIGLLADRVKVRYFVILAPGITCIAMSLLGLAPNFLVLVFLLLIAGISSTIYHVPSPVMIKRVSGERTGLGMSFYMLGGELARTLGPIVILGAVSVWGLKGTYKLIPFGIAASVFLYFQLKNIQVSKYLNKTKSEISIWKELKQNKVLFIAIAGFTFFTSAMKSCLTFFLPTFLTEHESSLWLAGISLSVLQFAGAGGTMVAGTISDFIGRKSTLIIAGIANPILMWMFIMFHGTYAFPILIVLGISLFAIGPVMLAMIQDIKTERPAFVNSIYMFIAFLLGSIVVILNGYLADKFGLDITYKISATGAFLAVPFIFFLKK